MEYRNIIFELNNNIGTIKFNRPKALNALNMELLNELSALLDEIAENEDIKVLILTGEGDKSFVAGADISELATFNALEAKNFSQTGHTAIGKIEQLPIPVIAAVNGFALGGGTEVALACDFIYASKKAKFGLPEITLGLVPGFGGTQRLPRLIGMNLAREMIFTGKIIFAEEAAKIGLVNRIFERDDLMRETLKTAEAIAEKGRVSLRAAKQTVLSGMDVDLNTGCKIEMNAFGLCMASEDAREGTTAFLEKRKAKFTGKL